MSEHRLEMLPEKMIEALNNEVRIRDAEIEKLRAALEDAANGFEVNGLYTRANKIYKVLDKA